MSVYASVMSFFNTDCSTHIYTQVEEENNKTQEKWKLKVTRKNLANSLKSGGRDKTREMEIESYTEKLSQQPLKIWEV